MFVPMLASKGDTIVALATPVGTSAIALLRVSGPLAEPIARQLLETVPPTSRTATRADYRDCSGALLDDVLLTLFRAPASYTGEDVLELSCHGNPFIAQKILEDLVARGCRHAAPGEFTQRAFLSGNMDLAQAEAVMDLIHARGERALAAANQQLRGALGRHMQALIDGLLAALARVEAYIDFPEEDLPPEDQDWLSEQIAKLQVSVSKLIQTNHYGNILRAGLRVALLGEPNVGKSSLLNALLGRDRALVSPTPGTTRDYLEEPLLLGGYAFRLIDTAGLNENPEAIEQQGIEKTLSLVDEADLLLLVIDASQPQPPTLPDSVVSALTPDRALLVANKTDLVATRSTTPLQSPSVLSPQLPRIATSALTETGLDALRAALVSHAESFHVEHGAELIAINARHADSLSRAKDGLVRALTQLRSQAPIELIASELRDTLDAFGEIAGRVDNERMLDQLFASFCIGK
ncbi:tRNA modification GTPase [Cephaloticoccus capnophilus]|uniref:tRNA modification GTPase MnmE n=2 Tax=Cephaloticoccus capnophilus TaxID=1548208 RepID=A0A139SQN1_9BACT|nr:tRNA modification GTPase [Cephaloticoccus capnophilus]